MIDGISAGARGEITSLHKSSRSRNIQKYASKCVFINIYKVKEKQNFCKEVKPDVM